MDTGVMLLTKLDSQSMPFGGLCAQSDSASVTMEARFRQQISLTKAWLTT